MRHTGWARPLLRIVDHMSETPPPSIDLQKGVWYRIAGETLTARETGERHLGTLMLAARVAEVVRTREGVFEVRFADRSIMRLSPEKREGVLGRSDFRVTEESMGLDYVSRQHVELRVDDDGLVVRDTSTRGTSFLPQPGVQLIDTRTVADERRRVGAVGNLAVESTLELVPPDVTDLNSVEWKTRRLYQVQSYSGGFATGDGAVVGLGTAERTSLRLGETYTNMPVFEESGETGNRGNEDAACVLPVSGGTILAVFDGMGGYAGGREASTFARERLAIYVDEWSAQGCPSKEAFLEITMDRLKADLDRRFGNAHADTTATLAFVEHANRYGQRKLFVQSAGDSLGFVVSGSGDRIRQVTDDHSLGAITVDSIGNVNRAPGSGSVLVASLRHPPSRPSRQTLTLERDDVLVLTTDGITGDSAEQEPSNGLGYTLRDLATYPWLSALASLKSVLYRCAVKTDDRTAIVFRCDGGRCEYPRLEQLWAERISRVMHQDLLGWEASQRGMQRDLSTPGGPGY